MSSVLNIGIKTAPTDKSPLFLHINLNTR